MARVRAQISGKRIRAGENNNFRFFPFLSGAEQKMQKKKSKKIKKIKKIPLWHHFKPKQFGKAKKEKN